MRYGFLFAGYDTHRSGLIVAWEMLVMFQKLIVTLVGSTIADAYLQILVAIMILVVSCIMQAYFQPYEVDYLNVLHTLGLFILIVTQVLSILYFYSQGAERPFMDADTLDTLITVGLFLANVLSIIAFLLTYAVLRFDVVRRWQKFFWVKVQVIDDDDVIADALTTQGSMWHHPTLQKAVYTKPQACQYDRQRGGQDAMWLWATGSRTTPVIAVMARPAVLFALERGEELSPGDQFCYLSKTNALSKIYTKEPQTGGLRICPRNKKVRREDEHEREAAEEYFYTDDNDADVLHGPFTMQQLSAWLEEGNFAVDDIVQQGHDGVPMPLSEAMALAKSKQKLFNRCASCSKRACRRRRSQKKNKTAQTPQSGDDYTNPMRSATKTQGGAIELVQIGNASPTLSWFKGESVGEGESIASFLFDPSHVESTEVVHAVLLELFDAGDTDGSKKLTQQALSSTIQARARDSLLARTLKYRIALCATLRRHSAAEQTARSSFDGHMIRAAFVEGFAAHIEERPDGAAAKFLFTLYTERASREIAVLVAEREAEAVAPSAKKDHALLPDQRERLDASDTKKDSPTALSRLTRWVDKAKLPIRGDSSKKKQQQWYYQDGDDVTAWLGPFAESKMAALWKDEHFDRERMIRLGEDGDSVEMITVFGDGDAAIYYYADADDASVLHGPFAKNELLRWVNEGHFELTHTVMRGRDGNAMTLAAVVGKDAEDTTSKYFYRDEEDPAILHGPFGKGKLLRWVTDGHFEMSHTVMYGRDGADVPLTAVLGREAPRWFYVDAEHDQHGPFTANQLEEWTYTVTDGVDGEGIRIEEAIQLASAPAPHEQTKGQRRRRRRKASSKAASAKLRTTNRAASLLAKKTHLAAKGAMKNAAKHAASLLFRKKTEKKSVEYYYPDVEDASTVHGPYTLAELQIWADEGFFHGDDPVREGKDGADVVASTLLTFAEFHGSSPMLAPVSSEPAPAKFQMMSPMLDPDVERGAFAIVAEMSEEGAEETGESVTESGSTSVYESATTESGESSGESESESGETVSPKPHYHRG